MEQPIDAVELVTKPSRSTQFFLFNLFADYIAPRGGRIWTGDLLHLLNLLGVTERAARTTLSRMKRQGWFVTHRDGRQAQYVITRRGRAILEEGDKRIFEAPFVDWDGRWRMVVYSLPEERRSQRHELRKKLIWFGFGNLLPGTWVSPHDRQGELLAALANAEIEQFVTMFTAVTQSNDDIVQKCWDIETLAADYRLFVNRYQPEYEAYRDGRLTFSAEECFVRRFWLTFNYQRFPRRDPNLPVPLLPADWIGFPAYHVFMAYRALLSEGMGDFVDDIINEQ